MIELIDKQIAFVVATVLKTTQSTPVKAGAKAIIGQSGILYGTVGGGIAEAECQRRSFLALDDGNASVFEFNLRGIDPGDSDPICGGSMLFLIDPTTSLNIALYVKAVDMLRRHERGMWITSIDYQFPLQLQTTLLSESDVASDRSDVEKGQLQACLTQEKPALIPAIPKPNNACRREVFLDPLIPRPILLLVGGGHVSQAVAVHASLIGFEIVVVEDRSQFACPSLFPDGTKILCGDLGDQIRAFPMQHNTYIVIATRGHREDIMALRACMHSPAAYIGMIGSRRKVPLIRQQFIDGGWATGTEFDRIHAPVGLDIGAADVGEIAVSIVAELIAVRRKKRNTCEP